MHLWAPHVIQHQGTYYMYYCAGDNVSKDPFHWDIKDKVGHIPAHAAEVLQDVDDKWYVSRCGWGKGGLYLAPLMWPEESGRP